VRTPPPSAPAVLSLPTLGGTAVQDDAPMPPVPTSAWIIFGLGLGALVLAVRRGRETSPAPRAPVGGFRSQPHDDVMLVEVA
jgi:hypothetical protein